MFDKEVTDILLKFLERKAAEAEKEILEKGTLSEDKAIPLLLKTQFNHIAHLDMEITGVKEEMTELRSEVKGELAGLRTLMDQRFEKVDQRFEKVDQRFEKVDQRFEKVDQRFMWIIGIGIASWVTIILTILFSA